MFLRLGRTEIDIRKDGKWADTSSWDFGSQTYSDRWGTRAIWFGPISIIICHRV